MSTSKKQYASSVRVRVPCLQLPKPPTKKNKRLNNLDPKQQALLDVFKDHLLTLIPEGVDPQEAQEFCEDATLVRYLRHASWQIKPAGRALQATLLWRAANRPDAVRWQDVAEEAAGGHNFVNGFDMAGRPLLYLCKRESKPADLQRSLALLVYNLQLAGRCMPPGVDQFALVVDFRVWAAPYAPDWRFVSAALELINRHYRDRMGACFLVNAPASFKLRWALTSPRRDPRLKKVAGFVDVNVDQLHAYGRNPLLHAVDGEQLLERYGGRCPYVFDAQFYGEAAAAAMRGGAAINISARAL